MRVEAAPSPGPSASDASDLLNSVVSGDSSVDQSTREALQRLLVGESRPSPAPADPSPAPTMPDAPARKVTATKPPLAPDSMEARRLAALAYVRRMRISAR
jgi:hypothetical protein